MAMNPLLTFPLALGVCSCSFETHFNVHQSAIYFGTVKDTNTGATLATFCKNPLVERSSVIVFSAEPGSVVEEEVLFEGRQERFEGSIPPERDEAFWCSGAPETDLRDNRYWVCLRSTDDDPPATMLAVERRGQLGDQDSSSGYALKLQVRHPGVLHLAFSAQCLSEHSDSSSGGVLFSWGELTIQ